MTARILYDITRPVHTGMAVWPGDPELRLGWSARTVDGGPVNVAELHAGVHVGTHADGPFHVLPEGARIAAVPLEAFVGLAVVADAAGAESIDAEWVADLLATTAPERLLFRTGCWGGGSAFPTRFPGIHPDAARLLAEAGVCLVGTDAPSVDPFGSEELAAHHVLCGAGIAILENLLLDGVPPGAYELIALPLRLEEADSSPVRAVLRNL